MNEVGIKLRKLNLLEVKLAERTDDVGCKRWRKVIRKQYKRTDQSNRDVIYAVGKEVEALGKLDGSHSTKEIVELLIRDTSPFIQLDKTRVTGSSEGVDVEQTDITACLSV